MNAVKLLKKDHDRVKSLFRKFENAGERSSQRTGLAEKIFDELEAHTTIEEELFYPAVAEIDRELVSESINDHTAVSDLIRELRGMEPDDEEYAEKFQRLIESVESHAEEEERQMFPEAEERLSEQLNRLGDEMKQRKDELISA